MCQNLGKNNCLCNKIPRGASEPNKEFFSLIQKRVVFSQQGHALQGDDSPLFYHHGQNKITKKKKKSLRRTFDLENGQKKIVQMTFIVMEVIFALF